MPVLKSTFRSKIPGHLTTILPSLFRKVSYQEPRIETIATPDNDFLELDWYDSDKSEDLVIISHGLEGNTRRAYIRGMTRHLHQDGYHVLAWNYRSCGTKINNALRFYHSGDTEDIGTIIDHCIRLQKYRSIVLVGFSMGGNVSLKYLGERSKNLDPIVRGCVAISAPIDLVGSSRILGQWQNKIYMKRFIRSLHKKVLAKSKHYPDQLSAEGYSQVKNFEDFDNRYTAPIHHFRDALDYWTKSSSLPYLEKIEVPTLILNALDDSFLSASCYPYDLAQSSKNIFLETPRSGGHVGFFSLDETYYTERRTLEFIKKLH